MLQERLGSDLSTNRTWNSRVKSGDYQTLKNFVRAYSASSPPRLLIFGDSVWLRAATDDQSPKTLGETLADFYQRNVCLVFGSGYQPDIFEQYCKLLAKLPCRPLLVVLPINLRCFSPTWDLNPLYQFHSEIDLLSSFDVRKPRYKMLNAEIHSESDSKVIRLESLGAEEITLQDFQDITRSTPKIGSEAWRARLKTIFQYHYTCPVISTHRKVLSLKRSVRLLRRLGVAVYSYFTPINYEAGVDYSGPSFRENIDRSIAVIRQELESESRISSVASGASIVRLDDFSCKFPREVFFTDHNATEHLRFEGRDFVARRIVEIDESLIRNDNR